MTAERYVEAQAVADYLSVPLTWVRDATRDGRLPCHAFGRYKRYLLSEVAAWAEKQRRGQRA